ncbi:MAG: homoserine dehydrogenase [Eggerthellaceae bacterium]|jgi:homoserine dehydrogenase|nr:homoserine dehydrogenase [Eggerthellaceae bacterium]
MAVKVGLVGTGTVGGGCLDILRNHKEEFKRHFGVEIELVRVCSRKSNVAEAYGLGDIFTTDFHDVVNDPEIDLVIELIGGTAIAKEVVMGALQNGKSVVTANKALMATDGEEIMGLAAEKDVEIAFEASVGGAIPIIVPLKHSLIANRIDSIMGIVNGTTNYMLTRMDEDGMGYEDVLREAQAKGYAEADPTADVDGFDAAAKIAILASIAFNSRVTMSQVYAEGIRRISPVDLAMAHEMGYTVKLLAHAYRTDAGIDVRVHPTMIPESHQLATVNGVFNAIYTVGDAAGESMFFGEGAGAGPAASAVMGDVLEVARHLQMGIKPIVGCTCTDELPILSIEDLKTKYYIRFVVADRSGVLAAAADIFAKYDVSVKTVTQRGNAARDDVDLVFVTHTAEERNVRKAIDDILALEGVVTGGFPSVIRVQD